MKSVVKGMAVAHVCLGLAGVGAVVMVLAVGWTQLPFLVSVVPAIFIAVFLVVTIKLLGNDMTAQRRGQQKNR